MPSLNSFIAEKEKLETEIANLTAFIESCPEGHLVAKAVSADPEKTSATVPNYRYVHRVKTGKKKYKETYLSKDKKALAELLAKRDYSIACLKDRQEKLDILNRQISILSHDSHAEQYLREHPGQTALLLPKLKSNDDFAEKWQAAPYNKSNLHPERLIFPTIIPGLLVRSKAEGDIVMRLVARQVPMRYEELEVINGIALHPDFTVLNVRTHEVFYIEHQGRWDDPKYVADVRWREDLFLKAGIYPWKKLLITTETEGNPFDVLWFDKIIDYYLK